MKATELMIGDLVNLSPGKDYVMIHAIKYDNHVSEDYVFDIVFLSTGLVQYNYSIRSLKPIPLTPEILEKNGFKNYGESWYLPDDNVNVRVGFYMYKTTIHVKKGDDIFQKEVRCSYRACVENRGVHIHTLQHALRLCGIEKEITL